MGFPQIGLLSEQRLDDHTPPLKKLSKTRPTINPLKKNFRGIADSR
jgi:hypothetical protein